jgi:phosphoglycolate phosphatase-like HAD superfamily hydrolase
VTKLVLWDIDHTLVDCGGVGAEWYAAALAASAGIDLVVAPVFAGATERSTTVGLLTAHGIEPTEEAIRALWRAMVVECERELERLPLEGRALPGAAVALKTFAGQGLVQTLVTGNLPEISRHKLTAFGLHEHVDFEIGGYGTLSAHRPDLVPHAVSQAAAKHGIEFAPEAVVVVGDTPKDVEAALHHGAVAVAVATGNYSADELRDAGAHTVLPDLADFSAVSQAVLG